MLARSVDVCCRSQLAARVAAHYVERPTTKLYAVVMLEPSNERRQSPAYPNTGAPSFDDQFAFEGVDAARVACSTVRLSLYDVDASRTRLPLGHLRVPLAALQLQASARATFAQCSSHSPAQEGGVHYLNRHLSSSSLSTLDVSAAQQHRMPRVIDKRACADGRAIARGARLARLLPGQGAAANGGVRSASPARVAQ